MSDINSVIKETVHALRHDELIEESGLSITLDELERCRSVLGTLGEEFSDAENGIRSILEELKIKRNVGYTWGFDTEIFFHIIRQEAEDLHHLLQSLCPGAAVSDDDLEVLRSVMQNYRRKPLEPSATKRTIAILQQLQQHTQNEQLNDELTAMLSLLSLALESP